MLKRDIRASAVADRWCLAYICLYICISDTCKRTSSMHPFVLLSVLISSIAKSYLLHILRDIGM